MNSLQTFNNEDFGNIRTLMKDGDPWFVGKDIALALGYSDTAKAITRHIEDEDKGVDEMTTPGGKQKIVIINESGMYCLILSSKLPNAKKFKRWVTSEVLPAIRKTGEYALPQTQEQRDITRDDYLRAASIVGSCRNERLPIVIRLLESAGLEVPRIMELQGEVTEDSDRDTTGETARMINIAINEYGFTVRRIERLTSISATEISRIRKGVSSPRKVRMRIICDALQKEIDKIESE